MFMEMLRQLASQEWACGMHSRHDSKPKTLPRPPRASQRRSPAEENCILAEDLRGGATHLAVVHAHSDSTTMLDFNSRCEREGTGFSDASKHGGFGDRGDTVPTAISDDFNHKAHAAYQKELRGIHGRLRQDMHQEAKRQRKAEAERTLNRSFALGAITRAHMHRQQSEISGCSSQNSVCSVPDLDGSVALGERFDETMEHVRDVQSRHRGSLMNALRGDDALTWRQQAFLRKAERKHVRQEIKDYQETMRQKLSDIASVDHAAPKLKRRGSFAHTVRDGVQEYFKQAATMDVYYPSARETQETQAHMSSTQRKAMERSIKILDRNRI